DPLKKKEGPRSSSGGKGKCAVHAKDPKSLHSLFWTWSQPAEVPLVASWGMYWTASVPYTNVIDSSGPSSPGPDQSIFVVKTVPNLKVKKGVPAEFGSPPALRMVSVTDL